MAEWLQVAIDVVVHSGTEVQEEIKVPDTTEQYFTTPVPYDGTTFQASLPQSIQYANSGPDYSINNLPSWDTTTGLLHT